MSLRDRLRRFERLERPRRGGPDGDERPSAEDRFDDLGAEPPPRPEPAEPAPAPPSAGDRFAPPRPRAPDVEARGEEEQPFLRCMRCETDCSRYARTCTTCGEELHGEAQRLYNEKLWAARLEERDEIDRANAGRRQALAGAEAEAALARRQAAELLAREVGERERRRLDGDPWGGAPHDPDDPGAWRDPTPIGLRWWRALRSPAWRLCLAGGTVLLLLLGLAFARRFPPLLVAVLSLLIGLFAPRRRWRRRFWW